MQWSYDLLEEAEQDLFDRLGVFVGRFSRSAALAVGAGSDGVSRAAELAVLVDASMIVADVGGRTTSYRMLPTLRDFAVMNLLERGELESMRRVHAEYLAADAANMGLRLVPMGPTRRIEESVSFEDFRAAADWALEVGFTELAMNLFLPLSHHWINGGRLAEAAHWLGRVRQLDVGESMVMWRLQLAAAILDFFAGRNELAEAAFRSLDASALRLTDPAAEAVAKEFVGRVRWRRGDLRGGRDEMAAAAEASLGLIGSAIWLFEGLAVLQLYLGDISRARHTVDRLVTFAEGKDDALATCIALNVQGWLASYEGDLPESIRCFEECRRIAAEQGDWNHEVNARLGLGWVLPGLRRPRQALAQAEAARGLSLDPGNRSKHAESMIVMGQALMDLGDLPRAALSVADGLQTLQGHIQRVDHMTRGLRIAGWIAAAQGRNDLAFRFMTVSDEHHRRMGYSDPPADAVRSRDALASVAQRLGDAERESLAGAAVGVSLADAVREAIGYLSEAAGTEVSVEPRRGDVERVSVQATPWTAST
jgi:tetratricopeptide (TPR) repeat protein